MIDTNMHVLNIISCGLSSSCRLGAFDPEEGFDLFINNNSRALHSVQSFHL